ncbi:MAG: peptide chain release factor N(5)-glutamine methyltransferase [Salinivirgaceae bacterium]
MDYTLQQTTKQVKELLIPVYGSRESAQLLFLIYENILLLSRWQQITETHTKVPISDYNQIMSITKRLLNHEPIQYILGETEFYGLKFRVNPAVLIPRPETEELVDWIIRDHKNSSLTIIDLGTGSGCIAVTLAKNLSQSTVYALDVSEQALEQAKANAQINEVAVEFFQTDVLKQNWPDFPKKPNLIVSNPPYVTQKEKKLMQANVLDYEPSLALFVSDDDPLLFYREIATQARNLLTDEGWLYFEINEALGNQTVSLLETLGYRQIELRADINGKHRMLKAQWKNPDKS